MCKEELFEKIYNDARRVTESRALPGGNLDSKEKTEYEDYLEKKERELDKRKVKNGNQALLDYDGTSNGYHGWDGTEFKKASDYAKKYNEEKAKEFEDIYKKYGKKDFD